MPPMADPVDAPPQRPRPDEPGERPPAGRLSRPPSERYATTASPGGSPSAATAGSIGPSATSAAGRYGPPIAAGLVTALLVVLVGGVLAEHRGLVFITGLGSGALGLLTARGTASPDGVTAPPWSRPRAMRIAVALGLATVALAALGIWIVSRLQGGVMDPLTYLWETTWLLVPALAVVAAVAAAIGVSAGPVRWRA